MLSRSPIGPRSRYFRVMGTLHENHDAGIQERTTLLRCLGNPDYTARGS